MKNKLLSVSAITLFLISTIGCSKDIALQSEVGGNDIDRNATKAVSQSVAYVHALMYDYAITLSKALSNDSVRQVLKEQAVSQFDGDFDVLVCDFEKIQRPNIRYAMSEAYSSLPHNYASPNYSSMIDELLRLIPNLQISVPVLCEEWNTTVYTPGVVVLPLDYIDGNDTLLPTYRLGNHDELVSTAIDPSSPFVVVGESERIDRNGQLVYRPAITATNSDTMKSTTVPSDLTVTFGGSNKLWLEWKDVDGEDGYEIYRRSDGSSNQLIATVEKNQNNYLDDFALVSGTKYYYTVRAIDSTGNASGFSSTASWYAAERMPGSMLSVKGMKFTNGSTLYHYESWLRGKPEIVLHVYAGTGENSSNTVMVCEYIQPCPSRNAIAGNWYSCDINIGDWDPETTSQLWMFSWSELDNRKTESLTLNFSFTVKDPAERWKIENGASVTYKITDHGHMGARCVNFWDKKGEEYAFGTGFSFKCE